MKFVQVNNEDTRTKFICSKSIAKTLEKICSKLTVKTSERRKWHRSRDFIINFEHVLYLFLCLY